MLTRKASNTEGFHLFILIFTRNGSIGSLATVLSRTTNIKFLKKFQQV